MKETTAEEVWLPNVPLIKLRLADHIVEYLWKQIDKAALNQRDANSNLAGNISKSLYLDDDNDYFYNPTKNMKRL